MTLEPNDVRERKYSNESIYTITVNDAKINIETINDVTSSTRPERRFK